ncbi:MAG: permease [Faecousia sp.]
MTLIQNFAAHFWTLMETLGWWTLLGLLLGWLLRFLPLAGKNNGDGKHWGILGAVVAGALLPMCNFAAVPIAAALLACGAGVGVPLAFLCSATLLNPAGLLLGWAYMGPALTVAYLCGALAAALLAGVAGERWQSALPERKNNPDMAGALIFWVMLGIAAQAALLTMTPRSLWQNLVLNPRAASLWEAAAAGVFRHVCIPDDISLAASLAASGLRPGWTVLLLMMGVCTNLPELFALYGTAGKKTAGLYLLTTVSVSLLAALLTQWVLGAGFVPQFNLANADRFTRLANLLSIRTWMPAKGPCAWGLLLLFGWTLWRRGRK